MNGPFPSDVWQHISVHLGPSATNIALLCKDLREVGQIGLFYHLQITGVQLRSGPIRGLRKTIAKRTLAFHNIASHNSRYYVRSIELVDWTSSHNDSEVSSLLPVRLAMHLSTYVPSKIWNYSESMFKLLAALPNLAHVSCTNIIFKTSTFHSVFVRSNALETVVLHNCGFPFDDTVLHSFKEVTVMVSETVRRIEAQTCAWAILNLISAQHCRRLRVEGPNMMLKDLVRGLVAKGEYPCLNSLELMIPTGCDEGNELSSLLSRCPTLHQITLLLDKPAAKVMQATLLPPSLRPSLRHVEIRLEPHSEVLRGIVEEALEQNFPDATHTVIAKSGQPLNRLQWEFDELFGDLDI
jgi:hypothetical protein